MWDFALFICFCFLNYQTIREAVVKYVVNRCWDYFFFLRGNLGVCPCAGKTLTCDSSVCSLLANLQELLY